VNGVGPRLQRDRRRSSTRPAGNVSARTGASDCEELVAPYKELPRVARMSVVEGGEQHVVEEKLLIRIQCV